MNKSQAGVLDRLHRIQVFLNAYDESFPDVNDGKARAELDETVSAIEAEGAAHYGAATASRSHTAELRVLRRELRIRHLQPIVAVARARSADVPLVAGLRVPRADASLSEFIAVATSTARAIGEHRPLFLEQHFPDDFVEQLVSAAAALQSKADAASSSSLRSVCATKALKVLAKRGRELIRLLDALVLSHVPENSGLAKTWRACTAVRRLPGTRRTTGAAVESPVEAAIGIE